jgi:hypothetical protein
MSAVRTLTLTAAFACAALGLGPRGAWADEPPAPAAPPAPQPSQAPAMTYANAAQVASRLTELAARKGANGKASATVTEYGRSAAGKPLLALWIGGPQKPCVLVHGGLAANDAAGTVACLDLAERLLSPEGTTALEHAAFVLLPAPNPDALDAFLKGQPRAGGGGLDRDRDGKLGEDGPEDLDGDGEVLRMRRVAALGAWSAAEQVEQPGTPQADARRMVEKGVDARRRSSYELFDEGRDDDGDGEVNEDPPGMDLGRQMAGWWVDQGPWRGEGAFAGQAPETRALMEFSFELPTLVAWYGFRSEGPFLLRASEHGNLADADNALYDQVGGALKARTGVEVKRASEMAGGRPNPGSDLDWAATHLGVLAFAIPVWRIAKQEGYVLERPYADEVDWLLWNDRALGGQGFKRWTPYEHSTLGAVEIGGWKRFTRREPPQALLGEAVRAVSVAPMVHAEFTPRLTLDVKVEDRGAGLFEVRARVADAGGGPTDTVLAGQRRREMAVRLALAPEEGVERVGGPVKADVGTLAAGASSAEVRWLIRRAPPRANRSAEPVLATVTAEHRVAGRVSAEVRAP